jgi:hypothetical protein
MSEGKFKSNRSYVGVSMSSAVDLCDRMAAFGARLAELEAREPRAHYQGWVSGAIRDPSRHLRMDLVQARRMVQTWLVTRQSEHDRQEDQAVEIVLALLVGAAVFIGGVAAERVVATLVWGHPASGTHRVVGLSLAAALALAAVTRVLIRAVRRGL